VWSPEDIHHSHGATVSKLQPEQPIKADPIEIPDDDAIYPASVSEEDSVNSTDGLMKSKNYIQDSEISCGNSFPYNAALNAGSRALEAFVRPSPIVVAGTPRSYGFNMKSCTFSMTMVPFEADPPEDAPTEIFIPDYFFQDCEPEITVSSGRCEMNRRGQVLRWWHSGDGVQNIKVWSAYTQEGVVGTVEGDEGWYDWYSKCGMM
jgi:hypothetical protein